MAEETATASARVRIDAEKIKVKAAQILRLLVAEPHRSVAISALRKTVGPAWFASAMRDNERRRLIASIGHDLVRITAKGVAEIEFKDGLQVAQSTEDQE